MLLLLSMKTTTILHLIEVLSPRITRPLQERYSRQTTSNSRVTYQSAPSEQAQQLASKRRPWHPKVAQEVLLRKARSKTPLVRTSHGQVQSQVQNQHHSMNHPSDHLVSLTVRSFQRSSHPWHHPPTSSSSIRVSLMPTNLRWTTSKPSSLLLTKRSRLKKIWRQSLSRRTRA